MNSEARPSTVFLFYYTSIFTILQPLVSGYHEIKVLRITRLRLSTKRCDKESTIKRSVDDSMISAEKVPG